MAQADSKIKKLTKNLKKQNPKSNKKRKRDESDSEEESAKNVDLDGFHLDLEENSINDGASDADLSNLDWGSANGSDE
jgi:glutamate/tyrosine decarboxylase-like PLP-dependent enzyme